jgi:hypothetical protein
MNNIPFQSYLKSFTSKVMQSNNRIARGILNSEGFAFCALAEFLDIDFIIESGVCNAGSTVIWAKYFSNIPIVAIDIALTSTAAIRTCLYHNITLIQADSRKVISEIIHNFSDQKFAIFIDGPKGDRAIKLAVSLFDKPQVQLIGIHDLYQRLYNQVFPARQLFNSLPYKKFCTDDAEFIEEFSFLDNDKDGNSYPKPDKYSLYGPTMGLIYK